MLTNAQICSVADNVTREAMHRYNRHTTDDWDLIRSDALLGIAKAIHDHDGTSPEQAYAYRRARGEVLDGVRDRAPVPRGPWAKGLTSETCPPQKLRPLSIEGIADQIGAPFDLPDTHTRSDFARAEDDLSRDDLLSPLDDRHRHAVIGYYWQQQTLLEIAAELGVTQARVCQMLKAARKRLAPQVAA